MNAADEHYVVISTDCHAGAERRTYKDYLESRWHDEFDAWDAAFDDPWGELADPKEIQMGVSSFGTDLNWNSDRRLAVLEGEGIVAEVIFPNTAPPFLPGGLFTVAAPSTRAEYERRLAGVKAHNRWLVDFCAETPGRRAGVAQIFLNDVEDTLAEIRWAANAGLTGGFLLPSDAPGGLVPLYYPRYDPIWELCADLGLPVHRHSNLPGDTVSEINGPAGTAIGLIESRFFAHRGLAHMIFAGVFERFPRLRFVMTEGGAGWVPEHLRELDGVYEAALLKGSIPEFFAGPAVSALTRRPSEYWKTNCYLGATFLTRPEAEARAAIGLDRIMWGSDLPHLEGTYPYTREALRATFSGLPRHDVEMILSTTPAEVYGFDLASLQVVADSIGAPTVSEVATPLLDRPRFPEQTVTPPLAVELPGAGRGVVTAH